MGHAHPKPLTPAANLRRRFAGTIPENNGQLLNMPGILPQIVESPRVARLDPETLKSLCEISPHSMLLVNAHGRIEKANPHAGELFGYQQENLVGQPVEVLLPETLRPAHRKQLQAFLSRSLDGQWAMRGGLDVDARKRDGTLIPVEVALVPVETTEGRAVVASVIDLRPRKALEAQLREERDLSDAILRSLPGVFYLLDNEGRFQRWNRNLERVTERSAEYLATEPAWSLFGTADAQRIRKAVETVFREGSAEIDAEFETPSGSRIPYHFTGLRVELAGRQYLTGSGIDISARKALEADLRHQANHDALTGLVNRHHFEKILRHELTRARRYGTPVGLIMMDLDQFKSVNDRFGHAIGDEVLRRFAAIVKDRIRASDTLCRWGGEEFMILLPQTDARSGYQMAEAIRALVAETPMPGPDRITVSLAVTVHQNHEPKHRLLRRLDDALYRAKDAGRNRVIAC